MKIKQQNVLQNSLTTKITLKLTVKFNKIDKKDYMASGCTRTFKNIKLINKIRNLKQKILI